MGIFKLLFFLDNAKTNDLDYLKENPLPVLKLTVKVNDSAFHDEFVLYREVNRLITTMYNAVDKHNTQWNGSESEVLMLTANDRDVNVTSSPEVIEDPPPLR